MGVEACSSEFEEGYTPYTALIMPFMMNAFLSLMTLQMKMFSSVWNLTGLE